MRIEIFDNSKAAGAVDIGAYAWMALRFTMTEASLPVPQVTDSDAFTALWDQGALVLTGLYDNDEIVGCRIVAVNSHLLSSTVMVGVGVLVFVDPRFRRRGFGAEMITKTNDYLEKYRNVWLFDEPVVTPQSREMFDSLGYTTKAFIMSRGS